MAHRLFSILTVLSFVFASNAGSEEISSPSQTIETYDHWALMCNTVNNKNEDGKKIQTNFCEVKTTVSMKSTENNLVPLLNINIAKPIQSEEFIILIQVPNGVFLRSNVILSYKASGEENYGKLAEATYIFCKEIGCLADGKLARSTIEQFFLRDQVILTFVDGARRTIGVPVSLLGFKNAYMALEKSKTTE